MTNNKTVDKKVEGSFLTLSFREFLINSAHFPLTNLILEALKANPKEYFLEADPYVLLIAAIVQSTGMTYIRLKNSKLKYLGNFIGPLFYSILEISLEGTKFFDLPQHYAYWIFAVIIFSAQYLKDKFNHPHRINVIEIFENLVRTLIPLTMYMLFENKEKSFIEDIPIFFSDPAHLFLAIVLTLLGLLLGFSAAQNSLARIQLKRLALKLKNYSAWSLGENILNQAVVDEEIFKIKRVNRAILFFDIRGFTKWSEKESPENVVSMLNDYYLKAEELIKDIPKLKVKYTADEIMIVFAEVDAAANAAIILRDYLNQHLEQYDLKIGGGIHLGPVVEGLIGSQKHKIFDVMGDTVNTAKRLCESAKGQEILVSLEFIELTEGKAFTTESREVKLKGKEKPYQVFPLMNYFSQ